MAGDWIKLHRKLAEHPIMQHDGLCRLWVYCLMRANWKPAKWLVPGTIKTVEVPRGSFITGRKALHKSLYPHAGDKRELPAPSESTLWRWLLSLESMGCIKLENVDNRCTMITVCNYATYQDDDRPMRTGYEQPVDSRWTAGGQPVNTEEESNNPKKERNLSQTRLANYKPTGDFNRPEVVQALMLWESHYNRQNPGEWFSDIMADALIMDKRRLGWSPQKFIDGITKSVAGGSRKTVLDPDESAPQRTASSGQYRQQRQKDYTP